VPTTAAGFRLPYVVSERRFLPPWSVEDISAAFARRPSFACPRTLKTPYRRSFPARSFAQHSTAAYPPIATPNDGEDGRHQCGTSTSVVTTPHRNPIAHVNQSNLSFSLSFSVIGILLSSALW
jgi:hypothetical protein